MSHSNYAIASGHLQGHATLNASKTNGSFTTARANVLRLHELSGYDDIHDLIRALQQPVHSEVSPHPLHSVFLQIPITSKHLHSK